jgi:LEA14-like dessication related protein
VTVIARNPNRYDVTVNDLQATLTVNAERLLTGRLSAPATLKAAADTRIEIEVKTDFVAMATVLQRVTHEGGLRYDIGGIAVLQDGLTLPLNRKGEVLAKDFLAPPQ